MRKIITTLSVLVCLYSTHALAFEEFSVGVATPSPTGLTFKFWQTRLTAYDMFAEWNFDGEEYNFHADYISHDYERFDAAETNMMFYHGYGIRALNEGNDETIVGLRLPLGVSYLMDDPPLDVFGEIAPRVNVAPSTNFGLDVMIGVRYRLGLGH